VPPIPTAALDDALHAPSVHNSQPWRWRITPDAVALHADPDRHLAVTDPDRRDLVLSCGAALHHLTVALAVRGAVAVVDRFPDPEDSTHLATVSIGPGRPATADSELYPAIAARRTERRRMSHRPVPADLLAELADHARRAGALLLPVAGRAARNRLAVALGDAGRLQRSAPGYPAELRLWTHRLPAARDGIPASAMTTAPRRADSAPPLRAFPGGQLREGRTLHGGTDDAAEFVVVATPGDDVLDRLRAGEATSAVLLAATLAGLATTPLSQATEVATVRDALRTQILHVPEHPQIVLRLGWPATHAEPLAPTPRRPLRSVLLP
jgi:nitroreductase